MYNQFGSLYPTSVSSATYGPSNQSNLQSMNFGASGYPQQMPMSNHQMSYQQMPMSSQQMNSSYGARALPHPNQIQPNYGTQAYGYKPIGISPIPYPMASMGLGKAVSPNQPYAQAVSPEAYHTSQYRGNQLGHDLYLRADSFVPAQQQLGYSNHMQGGYSS